MVDVLRSQGWLSQQPEAFATAVLQQGHLRRFANGARVFSVGDPAGGAYAIVSGVVAISIAPGATGPHLVHYGSPGWWFGEGGFLTGRPRMLGVDAIGDCQLFHLPLEAMERLAARDPANIRRFGQIAMVNIGLALTVIDGLLEPDPARRIAASLCRCLGAAPSGSVRISQAELGQISNVSRKVVNRVLREFGQRGWLSVGYGRIEVREARALRDFAAAG